MCIYLQIFSMAASLRFSRTLAIFVRLLRRLEARWFKRSSSSVTVILSPPPVYLRLGSLDVYLFSLFRIGDGLTRKSRRAVVTALARIGNFSDSSPSVWKVKGQFIVIVFNSRCYNIRGGGSIFHNKACTCITYILAFQSIGEDHCRERSLVLKDWNFPGQRPSLNTVVPLLVATRNRGHPL